MAKTKYKRPTVRMTESKWRIVHILKGLGEFGTIQDVSMDAIDKKIKEIYTRSPECKKIVEEALELFLPSNKTFRDQL